MREVLSWVVWTPNACAHYVGMGTWPPRNILKTTFNMVDSKGCFNVFPGK